MTYRVPVKVTALTVGPA